ncbi:hypothetical protein GQ44DRAFT_477243 [Phaeosphaeriaceae sp. PMI808]|nr:hypothetical protein GQ44DRAFT_477243 [Phaeosphaeriaceae sp. PMI808]
MFTSLMVWRCTTKSIYIPYCSVSSNRIASSRLTVLCYYKHSRSGVSVLDHIVA